MTTISALPTPPSRSDSVNFATRGDAFLAALPTFQSEANAVASETNAAATSAASAANAAQADRVAAAAAAAAVAAQSPVSNAAAAAASAGAAAFYAALAQATNPDSPIRLNPREISANITIGSDYNAASTGPLTIGDGITVTVNNNATWSIT